MADAPEGYVRLNIGLPLPLDVVNLVSNVLSKAWPGSKIDAGYSGSFGFPGTGTMSILIPEKEARRPKRITQKAIEEARPEPTDLGPEWDGDVTGIVPDGEDGITFRFGTPEALGQLLVHSCRQILADNPEAKNYLEWTMRDKDDLAVEHVLSIARSKGQTPHQIRLRVERERDQLAQAMWDARGALGFDNDGDPHPWASIAGMGHEWFAKQHVTEATEARKDHDDALGEQPTAEQVYNAWHGRPLDAGWGGCDQKEAVFRVLDLLAGRPVKVVGCTRCEYDDHGEGREAHVDGAGEVIRG